MGVVLATPYTFDVDRGKRRRFLAAGIVVVLALPILVTLGWYVAAVKKPDHFQFLAHYSPLASGVDLVFSGGGGLDGPTSLGEYRIYSWQESFAGVESRMSDELVGQGYVKTAWETTSVSWSRKDGSYVDLRPGRSVNRREAMTGKHSRDPDWVTVIIGNPAPENPMTHLRYGLEPNDY